MARTREIEYAVDGARYVGYLAEPEPSDPAVDRSLPGVLVAHEGPGISDHARTRARRLADELGYVAFALDYIGDGQALTDRQQIMAKLGPLRESPERTRALGHAGLAILLAQPQVDPNRIAAIGFCFGGTMALELARDGVDLRAVVGFHSGLATTRPGDAANITARVLVCIGADDPLIPPEQRAAFEAEMRAGGVDWQMNLYGGAVHSFTNPDADRAGMAGIAYDQPTDERSWQAMRELFDSVFR